MKQDIIDFVDSLTVSDRASVIFPNGNINTLPRGEKVETKDFRYRTTSVVDLTEYSAMVFNPDDNSSSKNRIATIIYHELVSDRTDIYGSVVITTQRRLSNG